MLCIGEVTSSNIALETDYTNWAFWYCSQYLKANVCVLP